MMIQENRPDFEVYVQNQVYFFKRLLMIYQLKRYIKKIGKETVKALKL